MLQHAGIVDQFCRRHQTHGADTEFSDVRGCGRHRRRRRSSSDGALKSQLVHRGDFGGLKSNAVTLAENTASLCCGLAVSPGNRGSNTARSGQEPHTPGGTKRSKVLLARVRVLFHCFGLLVFLFFVLVLRLCRKKMVVVLTIVITGPVFCYCTAAGSTQHQHTQSWSTSRLCRSVRITSTPSWSCASAKGVRNTSTPSWSTLRLRQECTQHQHSVVEYTAPA